MRGREDCADGAMQLAVTGNGVHKLAVAQDIAL
jgi:hypothetical protein